MLFKTYLHQITGKNETEKLYGKGFWLPKTVNKTYIHAQKQARNLLERNNPKILYIPSHKSL